MKPLTATQKEYLRALARSEFVTELLKALEDDATVTWQRSDTKEKREDAWQLSRAIRKLGNRFDSLFKEAEKP